MAGLVPAIHDFLFNVAVIPLFVIAGLDPAIHAASKSCSVVVIDYSRCA
jgi:hypothetical protein